ncbi:ribonuclease domain-containing protein [Actinokineospora sp. NPDC004072]
MVPRRRITLALVALVALVLGGWLVRDLSSDAGLPTAALSELPAEVAQTWALIERGGPFPYPDRDGSTFGNREGLLPERESGYYKEYTVPTPGSPDRGARRLVTGSADEVYYSADHYESFVAVDTSR